MSGVKSIPNLDRTGLVVLVAGAHASLLGVVAWRVVPMVVGPETEPKSIELVPQATKPLAELPELETYFNVPLREVRQAELSTVSLPAPDAYPQFQNLEASMRLVTATEPVVETPPPASEKPAVVLARASDEDAGEAFPPLPDTATQEALRNMLCDRMSASEDAACITRPQPRYVSAEVDLEAEAVSELNFYSDESWRAAADHTRRRTADGYVVRTVFAGRDVRETAAQRRALVQPARYERRAERAAPILYR